MLLPTILLAPSVSTSYICPSLNVYVSDNRGFLFNVLASDTAYLTSIGCVTLAPRNNTATTAPTSANDYTQLYGPGSLWENTTTAALYMCTAMGSSPGTATWTAIAAASGTLVGDGSAVTVIPTGASTARSLANLFADEYINVKTFGAVGNDLTDDTAAINAALTAAGSIGAPVYFPRGKYKVTSAPGTDLTTLGLRGSTDGSVPALWLIGDGPANSIIDGSATGGFTTLAITCSGGTAPGSRVSAFSGGIHGLGVNANYGSGPAFALGKNDTSDALNSFDITNVTVKNFSTSSTAVGTRLNFLLATKLDNLVSNCSQFGTALVLNSTQFCNFIGGSFSTAYNGVHITDDGATVNAYTFSNNFFAPDIENITNNCVLVDIVNGNGHNTFYGGQFVWNYGGPTTNYAISSSASSGSALTPPSTRFYDVNFAPGGGSGALYGGVVLDPSNNSGVAIFGNNYGDGTTPASGSPASGTTYTNSSGQAQVVTIYASSGMTSYNVQINPALSGPLSTINGSGAVTFTLRPGYSIQCSAFVGGGTLSWLWFPLAA